MLAKYGMKINYNINRSTKSYTTTRTSIISSGKREKLSLQGS
jgi:hypothetical protein